MGMGELSRAREQEFHGLRLDLKEQIASTSSGTPPHAALCSSSRPWTGTTTQPRTAGSRTSHESTHCTNPEDSCTSTNERGHGRRGT